MTRPSSSTPTRSTRKRKASARVRTVSQSELSAARQRRLDSLENDNYAAESEALALAEEPEYDPDADSDDAFALKSKRTVQKRLRSSGRKGKKVRLGIERWNKRLNLVLEEEQGMEMVDGMVKWGDIQGGKSVRPPRKLCSVCGYSAAYTCTRCLVRFCSVACGNVHRETRCLKLTV